MLPSSCTNSASAMLRFGLPYLLVEAAPHSWWRHSRLRDSSPYSQNPSLLRCCRATVGTGRSRIYVPGAFKGYFGPQGSRYATMSFCSVVLYVLAYRCDAREMEPTARSATPSRDDHLLASSGRTPVYRSAASLRLIFPRFIVLCTHSLFTEQLQQVGS